MKPREKWDKIKRDSNVKKDDYRLEFKDGERRLPSQEIQSIVRECYESSKPLNVKLLSGERFACMIFEITINVDRSQSKIKCWCEGKSRTIKLSDIEDARM